jgi:hypothetical protein
MSDMSQISQQMTKVTRIIGVSMKNMDVEAVLFHTFTFHTSYISTISSRTHFILFVVKSMLNMDKFEQQCQDLGNSSLCLLLLYTLIIYAAIPTNRC